jgi:hypothetical protein
MTEELFRQMLFQGNIALPKYGSTLTLKEQPDGKYAVLLDGVELPIVGFQSFTPPLIPQRELRSVCGEVFIQTGHLQPGTLGITVVFDKLEVVTGHGQTVEEHPYRREGLDL